MQSLRLSMWTAMLIVSLCLALPCSVRLEHHRESPGSEIPEGQPDEQGLRWTCRVMWRARGEFPHAVWLQRGRQGRVYPRRQGSCWFYRLSDRRGGRQFRWCERAKPPDCMTGCHVMGGCCTELYWVLLWVLLSCGVRVRAEEWIPTLKAARTELTKSIENPFWL